MNWLLLLVAIVIVAIVGYVFLSGSQVANSQTSNLGSSNNFFTTLQTAFQRLGQGISTDFAQITNSTQTSGQSSEPTNWLSGQPISQSAPYAPSVLPTGSNSSFVPPPSVLPTQQTANEAEIDQQIQSLLQPTVIASTPISTDFAHYLTQALNPTQTITGQSVSAQTAVSNFNKAIIQ